MARGMAAADLTLAVRAHEIVGIAGVSGNGQRALAALIAGMAPPRGGTARLDGAPWPAASPRASYLVTGRASHRGAQPSCTLANPGCGSRTSRIASA